LQQQKEHFDRTLRGLMQDLLEAELREDKRVLCSGAHAAALVPVCARYTYETWIAPLRPAQRLYDLSPDERRDLARALKLALLKLDDLWQRPMPTCWFFTKRPPTVWTIPRRTCTWKSSPISACRVG
jgi:UDPglucose--hexose-1-phosphate uridylyltransferase